MAGKMKAVTAAVALVNMLELVEAQAVVCCEQEYVFEPSYFPGLIALAQFVAERVESEPREALESAEKHLRSLTAERDKLRAKLDAMTAQRAEIPTMKAPAYPAPEPFGNSEQLPAEPWRAWKVGTVVWHWNDEHKVEITSSHSGQDKRWLWEQGYREQPSVGADGEGQS